MPAAMPPPTAAPTTLAIEIRELALTRVKFSGSRRGTADAWVTVNALEATRQPSAAGNSHSELSSTSASTQHRNAAQGQRDPDRPAAAVPEPVEERPDQRRHDGERCHGQQQELGHLGPGLVGGQGEEQRSGQRHRDRGVPGGGEELQVDQPGQPALARPARQGVAVDGPGPALDLAADEPDRLLATARVERCRRSSFTAPIAHHGRPTVRPIRCGTMAAWRRVPGRSSPMRRAWRRSTSPTRRRSRRPG